MGQFLWLLGMTAETVWPFYAVAFVTLVATWAYRRRNGVAGDEPPIRLLAGVLAAPLALTAWSSLTSGVEHRAAGHGGWGWASVGLLALAVASLGAVGYVVWRWRQAWVIALPTALAVVVATAMTWFIGAMAIADDWI